MADPHTHAPAWDDLAISLGINLDEPGSHAVGLARIGYPRPPGPSRKPSPRCESGKRPYCTCSICF